MLGDKNEYEEFRRKHRLSLFPSRTMIALALTIVLTLIRMAFS